MQNQKRLLRRKVHLTEAQSQQLKELAAQRKGSVAALVREGIELFIMDNLAGQISNSKEGFEVTDQNITEREV